MMASSPAQHQHLGSRRGREQQVGESAVVAGGLAVGSQTRKPPFQPLGKRRRRGVRVAARPGSVTLRPPGMALAGGTVL